MKNINLIIDFDSTFIKLETLDALAEISLQNNSNKKSIIEDITSITKSAMNGEINFDIALSKRIKMLEASSKNIEIATSQIENQISKSIIDKKNFFNQYADNCYIVSGGFIEIIFIQFFP